MRAHNWLPNNVLDLLHVISELTCTMPEEPEPRLYFVISLWRGPIRLV